MRLHLDSCVVQWLPELSIEMHRTSYLFHGSNRLHPPLPVELICQVLAASGEATPWTAEPFWILGLGFVIFAQLALLWLFIMLIYPILAVIGTCNIAHTVANRNHHPIKCVFRFSGRWSRVSSCLHIVLLLPNRCLCIFNSLPCPSGFSFNIILDPFLFLFIA